MSYDLQLVQVPVSSDFAFPVGEAGTKKLLNDLHQFGDLGAVRAILLRIEGCRTGPGQTVDFVGRGLNCARLSVQDEGIHVENNCGAPELLKLYRHLLKAFPELLIFDLQSKQLHNAASFEQWWSRPL